MCPIYDSLLPKNLQKLDQAQMCYVSWDLQGTIQIFFLQIQFGLLSSSKEITIVFLEQMSKKVFAEIK